MRFLTVLTQLTMLTIIQGQVVTRDKLKRFTPSFSNDELERQVIQEKITKNVSVASDSGKISNIDLNEMSITTLEIIQGR